MIIGRISASPCEIKTVWAFFPKPSIPEEHMPARILHIHIAPAEGAPVQAREEVTLDEEKGLLGDRYEGTDRSAQVTIVSTEELAEAAEELGFPIPPGATRRNITIEGLSLEERVGQRIALGEAVLEITRTCPPCNIMETCVGPGARKALEKRAGVRAMVEKGGRVRPGDPVHILP
jgi:MOSC domain-containing protein YiiM